MDIAGGIKSDVVFIKGVFYAWNGKEYVQIDVVTEELAKLVAGTQPITGNIGTPATGVTAVEYGNAHQHVTVLTLTKTDAFTLGDNANLADGSLIYTFPAGALWVNSAYLNVNVTNTLHDTGVCELGLGTAINEAAVAVLGATAGSENIITGTAAAINTALVAQAMWQTSPFRLPIQSGNDHTVFLNIAGAWTDVAAGDLTADATGTVVLEWTFLA